MKLFKYYFLRIKKMYNHFLFERIIVQNYFPSINRNKLFFRPICSAIVSCVMPSDIEYLHFEFQQNRKVIADKVIPYA